MGGEQPPLSLVAEEALRRCLFEPFLNKGKGEWAQTVRSDVRNFSLRQTRAVKAQEFMSREDRIGLLNDLVPWRLVLVLGDVDAGHHVLPTNRIHFGTTAFIGFEC